MENADKMTFKLVFAAAGCNRRPGALSALPSQGIAAYAANSNVMVIADDGRRISASLPVHRAPITVVKLLADPSSVYIASSASNGQVALWRSMAGTHPTRDLWSDWQCLLTTAAHDGSIVALDGVWSTCLSAVLVATAGVDGFVRLWKYVAESRSLHQLCGLNISGLLRGAEMLPKCIAICTAMEEDGELSERDPALILALGTTHRELCILATNSEMSELKLECSLGGHRDWICSVSFSPAQKASDGASPHRLIATASKDGTARVWKMSRVTKSLRSTPDSLLDPFFDLGPPKAMFSVNGSKWELCASALLEEHAGPVQSVCFETANISKRISPRLLTSSMDCSLGLWRNTDHGRWICVTRFGLLGGAGAHQLGFFGAVFLSKGISNVMGHNFGGALHRWNVEWPGAESESTSVPSASAAVVPGGHSGPVRDLAWEPRGRFLLTCGEDKTARIFMSIQRSNTAFVEWARPQIHGHAISAASFCKKNGMAYVSGAEERMLRIFEAPRSFARFSGRTTGSIAEKAVIPELGLSNKAVYAENGTDNIDKGNDQNFILASVSNDDPNERFAVGITLDSSSIPLEEELKQGTIWPESGKLYGHGNEISCVAVNLESGILASACHAQKAADAVIRLWKIESGLECGQLAGHELTVTQLQFSSDGLAILSVSRDRSIAIFEVCRSGGLLYSLRLRKKAAHSRMIYSGAWLFSRQFVISGGRDKRVRFFKTGIADVGICKDGKNSCEEDFRELACLKYSSGAAAIDTLSLIENASCFIAVGFENGSIRILKVTRQAAPDLDIQEIAVVSHMLQCSDRITRLRWRPHHELPDEDSDEYHFAVASEDNSVRVISFCTGTPNQGNEA